MTTGARHYVEAMLKAGSALIGKLTISGAAKGATASLDVTATAQGADHNGLDVMLRDASGNALVGPTTPSGSLPTVAAQSQPVCWQVPVTGTGRALLIAWASGTAYTAGQAVINDSGKVYVCRTAGTSAGSGGPTGTNADITDNTAHWRYVAASATAFKGSMILRNLNGSAQPLYYSLAADTAPGGAEIPAGQAEAVFYGDATGIFVATSTGTATASVAAYP